MQLFFSYGLETIEWQDLFSKQDQKTENKKKQEKNKKTKQRKMAMKQNSCSIHHVSLYCLCILIRVTWTWTCSTCSALANRRLFFVVVVGFCFDECCQLSGVVQDGVKVDIESAQTTVVIETETNLID